MFVVTVPPSAAADPKSFAEHAKESGADLLEIRGDLTPKLHPFTSALPLIVSPRSSGKALIEAHKPKFVDLTIDEKIDVPAGTKIIRSMHDYQGTPQLSKLKALAEQMFMSNADIIKISTMINSYEDILTLQSLQKILPPDRAHSFVGMGPKGHLTRILSPLCNALTYTCLEVGEASAPGQIPLSLCKLTAHCKNPKIFGILGGPTCTSSLSPLIHNTLFHRHGIDAVYSIFETDDLNAEWEPLMRLGIAGFSVTSPWKRVVLSKLDQIEAEAQRADAVNTAVKRDAGWIGYPRDAEGMIQGYPFLRQASSAIILGSGGVVAECIAACRAAEIRDNRIYARNMEDRSALTQHLMVQSFPLEDVAKQQTEILICAISSDISIPLPEPAKNAHAIDLRYGKETQFMKDAKARGYTVHDGAPMLLHQALEQYELFSGIRPSQDDLHVLERLLSLPS